MKKITVKHRSTCRLCDSPDIVLAVKMEPIPPQELYLENAEDARAIERLPVDIYFCEDCSHVQQLDILDSETLWQDYTYESSKAKGMMQHFQEFTDDVLEEHNLQKDNGYILDIGSNDGALLSCFKNEGFQVIGVDPAKNLAEQATKAGIPTYADLFDVETAKRILDSDGKAAVITAFNAFAHADNLNDIADGIRLLLKNDGLFYFEVQYLLDVLDKVLIGTIFHEHLSHHSLLPMMQFLSSHGLELIDVKRVEVQHGALIGKVQLKGGPYHENKRVSELVSLEKERGLDRLETVQSLDKHLDELKIQANAFRAKVQNENALVAAYGAARSGQSLISQLQLDGIIEFIVDNHPQKIGKFPAGDGIPVVSTELLQTKKPDYTVILAWVHVKVIVANNRDYLQRGGVFVVLTPQLTLVTEDNVNSFLDDYGVR